MTIKGTYKNGQIRLDEIPTGVDDARVEVHFVEEQAKSDATVPRLRFGMFRKDGSRLSTWEDFVEAKKSLHSRLTRESE